MKNRVELVSKELHYKFFQSIDPPQQKEQNFPQRHNNLSSQILIKNLIKKGFFTTTNSFKDRSKTVKNMLPQVKTSKTRLKTFQRTNAFSENEQKQKNINFRNKYNNPLTGAETLKEKPALKFEQFDQIINKLEFERTNEEQRRKIKLQRYSKKKFASKLRKASINTQGN